MQTERLVTMANQIGDFYQSFPDKTQSKIDIAGHLEKFWAKSMRDQIIFYVNEQNGDALHPIVREAIVDHLILKA